jgi:acetylornithine/succinyldiaminopimelate/putrescine aminotransferase
MVGVEFAASYPIVELQRRLYERGVLALTAGGGVRSALRLAPPLNVKTDHVLQFLDAFRATVG